MLLSGCSTVVIRFRLLPTRYVVEICNMLTSERSAVDRHYMLLPGRYAVVRRYMSLQ